MLKIFYSIFFINMLVFATTKSVSEINKREAFILKIHEIGAIKFGKFKLKSGIESPIYVDLRLIISYPETLLQAAEFITQKIRNINFDIICPVPYGAIPMGVITATTLKKPMILHRKEAKDHGTKKMVEGAFKSGDNCLIIEDLVTTGVSILETISILQKEEIKVKDIVFLVNREQGGTEKLEQSGYNVHYVFSIYEILDTLMKNNRIDTQTVLDIKKFISDNIK